MLGITKVSEASSSLVQISSSEKSGQTCKIASASVWTLPLLRILEVASNLLSNRKDGTLFSRIAPSLRVLPVTSAYTTKAICMICPMPEVCSFNFISGFSLTRMVMYCPPAGASFGTVTV